MLIVNRNDIKDFTEFSHDRNPLHIDADYARKTPFGDCVVYGILGIIKILNKILADDEQEGIFIESIQYKFHSPIRENKAYQLVKIESTEGSWQLFNNDTLLAELQVRYFPGSIGEVKIEKNSISYYNRAANPNDIDLVNFVYEEDYALDGKAWDNFLQRHPNLEKIPLEQLTCLIWTSYCIGMRAPGRQALYMGGKIDFTKDTLDQNHGSSLIKCSISTHSWDSSTGNLVLNAKVKAQNRVIAKVNLNSLKRPDSVVISMKALASNWDRIPTNHWLQGKVCLVTGGSRGLGSAIAKTLALFDAIVAINYRSSEDDAKAVLQDIKDNGGKAFLCSGDISEPGICQKIVDEIVQEYGGLDLVVNNAHPFIDYAPFTNLDFEQFQRAVMTPLQISYEVSQAVINELQKRRGKMVTISSIYAQKPELGFSGYSSAKNAVEGLIRSLAVEFPDVSQVIYRPSKFLSDQTATNFSQIHLQNPIEVVKNLWIGLDKVQSENINPFIFDQSLVHEVTQPVSEELAVSPIVDTSKAKIVISATFTAEPIAEALSFWIEELKLPAQIEFAPYNQVFQQLLDPSSQLATNQEGTNIILVNFEDWLRYDNNPEENNQSKIERNVDDLLNALKSAAKRSSTPYLVCLCPASPAFLSVLAQAELVAKMETVLKNELARTNGVYLVTSEEITTTYPVVDYFDPQSNELGHVPYSPAFFCTLATTIARKLFVLRGASYKVIAIDCDQTLWKGVCGEVGAAGIEIDPAREKLQQLLLKQQEAGVVLCLCSKNVEEDVIEVFKQRPDMPLKLDRLVSWRINWQAKSANLKSLAKELNLGLDSFIFIDDDPVQCAEVRANCPQVLTLQIPQEAEAIEKFVAHTWAFDRLKVTAEDQKRTQLYQQNVQRERLKENTLTFQDFLAQLQLEITIKPPQPEQVARLAQLTQRTNQFNATTIRRTESEIEQLIRVQEIEARAITVKDRFGDYGLVGEILFREEKDTIVVDTFLLSCRVLGRGVEYKMLTELGKIANNRSLTSVKLTYLPTPKNQPILNFLQNVGAQFQQQTGNSLLFQLPVSFLTELNYNPQSETDADKAERKNQAASNSISVAPVPTQSNSLVFERIAQELSDMEQILSIINSQQVREEATKEHYFVAPRNATEEKLAQIWSEILKVKPIGIQDNFFDLGGNSLIAVQLFAKIEHIFRQKLPLTTLLHAATIEQLALNLEQEESSADWSPIVPLQPNGSKTPLFLLHARGASVLVYRSLANCLETDRPVYGVQPQGLNEQAELLTTVEEMAAYYIQEIKKIQPIGPYLLGGYSFGGELAFEMSRQLHQQGEKVDQLILFDCRGPNSYKRVTFSQRILIHFNNLLARKHNYIIERVLDWKRWLQDDLQYNLQKLSVKVFQNLALPLPLKLHNTLIEARNQQAARNYQPQFYPGKVTLMRAEEWLGGVGCEIDEYLGWKDLVGEEIDIYPIPGHHFSMFDEPYVQELGETLKSCFNP